MGGGGLVGWLARAHEAFAWDTAAVAGTGFATLALAIYTGGLATVTNRDVTATQRLANLAQLERDAANEPFLLVGITRVLEQSAGNARTVRIELFNVGRGPARDIGSQLIFLDGAGNVQRFDGAWLTKPVLLPAAQETFDWAVPFNLAVGDADRLTMAGTYVDRDGKPDDRYTFGYPDTPRVRPSAT